MLQATPPAPIEDVLVSLINDLSAASPARWVLVLDDLHLVTEPRIHQGLSFLLDNLPPATGSLGGLHLVIASRADLPWPIARMRARSELTELRPADLRFTPAEVSSFLNDVVGLEASPFSTLAWFPRVALGFWVLLFLVSLVYWVIKAGYCLINKDRSPEGCD